MVRNGKAITTPAITYISQTVTLLMIRFTCRALFDTSGGIVIVDEPLPCR